jgi:hypothetical protein
MSHAVQGFMIFCNVWQLRGRLLEASANVDGTGKFLYIQQALLIRLIAYILCFIDVFNALICD